MHSVISFSAICKKTSSFMHPYYHNYNKESVMFIKQRFKKGRIVTQVGRIVSWANSYTNKKGYKMYWVLVRHILDFQSISFSSVQDWSNWNEWNCFHKDKLGEYLIWFLVFTRTLTLNLTYKMNFSMCGQTEQLWSIPSRFMYNLQIMGHWKLC
jgi:hypothetical protein